MIVGLFVSTSSDVLGKLRIEFLELLFFIDFGKYLQIFHYIILEGDKR